MDRLGPGTIDADGTGPGTRRPDPSIGSVCSPGPPLPSPSPEARQLAGLDPGLVCETVARHNGLEPSALSRRHEPHIARLTDRHIIPDRPR